MDDGATTRIVGECTPGASPRADAPALPPRLGRYELGARIGRGGGGFVFEGRDPGLDRTVAIKVLHLDAMTLASERQRLLREAQALAQISNDGVVRVFDFGVDPVTDAVYLVMERIQGSDLREWLATPRPWREVLDAFLAAGRGLAAAHAAGVIHRDFKPANVLIDRSGRVCVGDFGLARTSTNTNDEVVVDGRSRSAAGGSTDDVTLAGTIMGTPLFMAPEQHRGGSLTPSADQFAFCVALFVALGASPPFVGRTFSELEAEKRRGPRKVVLPVDVPSDLFAVLRRGLACEPARRHADMTTLLARLEHAAATRKGSWPRLAAFAGGAAVVGIVVPRGSTGCDDVDARAAAVWNDAARVRVRTAIRGNAAAFEVAAATRVTDRIDSWVAAWRTAADEVCSAAPDTTADAVAALRTCLQRDLDELGAVISVLESEGGSLAEHAMAVVTALPTVDACDDASDLGGLPTNPFARVHVERLVAQLARADALINAARPAESLAEADRVIAFASDVGFRPLVASGQHVRGLALVRLGSVREGVASLESAALLADELGLDAVSARAKLEIVAQQASALGDLGAARDWLEHARAANQRANGRGFGEAAGHDAEGAIAIAEGQLARAREHFERAAALSDEVELPTYLSHVGVVLSLMGDQQAAAALHRRARALVIERLGPEHPSVAVELGNEGVALWVAGDRETAAERYAEELALVEAAYPPDHPTIAVALMHAMDVARHRGDLDHALVMADRVVAIRSHAAGLQHAQAIYARGLVLKAMERYDDAATQMQRSIDLAGDQIGADHSELIHPLLGYGDVLLSANRPAESATALERGLVLFERAQVDLRLRVDLRFLLARARWRLGEHERAREIAAAALADCRTTGSTAVADEITQWLAAPS